MRPAFSRWPSGFGEAKGGEIIKISNKIILIGAVIGLLVINVSRNSRVSADWWERPTARPSTPSDGHDRLPSPTTQIVPTSQPTQTQPTPTGSHVGGLPSPTPTQGTSSDGKSTDDPCASGKSYSGPYCGWSPSVGTGDGTSSSNNGTSQPRIGGLKVLGLSNTSGEDLKYFDIIALTGILCLLLYVRSKLPQVNHQ